MTHEKEIRRLLDRYFAGETTRAEERELRNCFTSAEQIPEDLRYAVALFTVFGEASKSAPGREITVIPAGAQTDVPEARTRRSLWMRYGAAAAIIAAIAAFGITFFPAADKQEIAYCYVNGEPVTDYEMALQYNDRVLALIAVSLNKSIRYFASLEQFDHAWLAIGMMSRFSLLEAEFENN